MGGGQLMIGSQLRSAALGRRPAHHRWRLGIRRGPLVGVTGPVAPDRNNSITCSTAAVQEVRRRGGRQRHSRHGCCAGRRSQGLSTVVSRRPRTTAAPHRTLGRRRRRIPNNEVLKRRGVREPPEAARTYLHGIVGEIVERNASCLDRGPEMLSFVLKATPLNVLGASLHYYPG